MYEGINYGGYALQQVLLYLLAERNACPKRRQKPIPQLDSIAAFFCQTCYPRTGPLYTANFGDSHLATTGYNALLLLAALGRADGNAEWYISQVSQRQHREQYSLDTPMGLLYTPDKPSHTACSLPTCALFASHGWATMRSSWQKDATMVAIKSGVTWNHAHADAASLLVYHLGEQIIGEAGRCWYASPQYRKYHFQSEAHNVVLADGCGQPRSQQYYGSALRGSIVEAVNDDGLAYILADATGPNADRFLRYFRHLLMIGRTLLVIDDLQTLQPATLTWIWHPMGETLRRGASLITEKGRAKATITPLFPEQFAPSAFQQDYPNTLIAEPHSDTGEDLRPAPPYYTLTMPYKTERAKGITAIQLSGAGPEPAPAKILRREGRDWIGVRITEAGHTTDVYVNQLADGRLMHQNSWIEADGLTTDAYMLVAVDGRPRLMVYGSVIRGGGKVLFSSLEKRTAFL